MKLIKISIPQLYEFMITMAKKIGLSLSRWVRLFRYLAVVVSLLYVLTSIPDIVWLKLRISEISLGPDSQVPGVDVVFIADSHHRPQPSTWEAHHDDLWKTFSEDYANGASRGRKPPESLKRLVIHPNQCATIPYKFYNRIQSDLKAWRYLLESHGPHSVRAAIERFTSTPELGERVIAKRTTYKGMYFNVQTKFYIHHMIYTLHSIVRKILQERAGSF
jgi:hypothetical protein